MSRSEKSFVSTSEFSYQTRLVVYNFLGLVPTQAVDGEDENEGENGSASKNQKTREIPESEFERSTVFEDGKAAWKEELDTLPTVSLIDRLSESEIHVQNTRSLCQEVKEKVKRLDSSSLPRQQRIDAIRGRSMMRLDSEELHRSIMTELRQRTRGYNNKSPGNELDQDDSMSYSPMTVIKKRNSLKVLMESTPAVPDSDGQNRFSMSRHSSFRLPTPPPANHSKLDSSHGNSILRDTPLSNVDEEAEEGLGELVERRHGQNVFEDSWSSSSSEFHFLSTSQNKAATPGSVERQFSTTSCSSRRFSTYVDIKEVDVASLVKSKALPPMTLPLQKEISKAIEDLEERKHESGSL